MAVKDLKKAYLIENNHVILEISKKDAMLLSVTEKASGKSIVGEAVPFFYLADKEKNAYETKSLEYENGVFTLDTEKGKIKIAVEVSDNHFIFESKTSLPGDVFALYMANGEYSCDTLDESAYRAVAIAMTVNVDPIHYPDGLENKTTGWVREHLGGAKGARVGLVIVPNTILRESLQELCLKIDPQKGIVLRHSGPWSWENRSAHSDYMIVRDTSPEYLKRNIERFKYLGVDQLDFHQGQYTVRQGDFKPQRYKNYAEFKKNVSDYLHDNSMESAIHTYAFYIQDTCHEILSDPVRQSQLITNEEFTLAEDVSDNCDFLPSVESTSELSDNYGFFSLSLPYIIVGEEIIKYVKDSNGFKSCVRGACGTKAVPHKKGEKIKHFNGFFNRFSPILGSDLFLEIAHNTARAYNEGGFDMIYIDAIDGTCRHCGKGETAYYIALFVHEILKNCIKEPTMELSDMPASAWASRARMGALDVAYRNYKNFNNRHHLSNQKHARRFYACTMGWYHFYPTTDEYPGNQHTKYHHWDSIDHLGALSVAYDYSTVFNGGTDTKRYAGAKRNIELFRMYSRLRKSQYFKHEILEKARKSEHELAIREKSNGKYAFFEKNYQTKRLYDIADENRNTAEFVNPFKKQTPFIRMEIGLSTLGEEPLVILPMNENKPISEQIKVHDFGGEFDFREKLAMKVRVKGNGKKGIIGIRLRAGSVSSSGYGLYTIDTDFEGWRDFVLLEADNGDRPYLEFEKKSHIYPIYSTGLKCERMCCCGVETDGDVEGVLMSSVTACRQVYNVVKNPTVTIGKETVKFECEIKSSDFIEWDGDVAKVIDRYGNEKTVWFEGSVSAPKGKLKAKAGFGASLNNCPVNVHLTIGTTGREIK